MSLVGSVTDNVLIALSRQIFNNPKATQDRMYTRKSTLSAAKKQGKSYFEVAVLAQAVASAPGLSSFPVLNLQNAVSSFCCSAANGEKLRDLSYDLISSGVNAGRPEYGSFSGFLDKKNYIDFFVTQPGFEYNVPITALRGACDPNDIVCTTVAPILGGGSVGPGPKAGASPNPKSSPGTGSTLAPDDNKCRAQSNYCDCANFGCTWQSQLGCMKDLGNPINCMQCPTLSFCPNAECAVHSTPCECANAPATCGWNAAKMLCTNELEAVCFWFLR